MTVNNSAEGTSITEFQPVASGTDNRPSGQPYLVGGYDAITDALRTWRLDADHGVVGVPVDRDITEVLIDAGYDRDRAMQVTAAAITAVTVFDIDQRFKEQSIWEKLSE